MKICSQAGIVCAHSKKWGRFKKPGPPVHDDCRGSRAFASRWVGSRRCRTSFAVQAPKADVIDLVVDPTRNRFWLVTWRRGCSVRDPMVRVCTIRSELTTATADPTRRIRSNADCA